MSEEEKEAIEEVKRTIKNSNFCDNIGIGQIEILLNYIDKLQKENEELKEDKAVLSKEILTDKAKIVSLKQENEELIRKTYNRAIINDKGEIQFVFDNYISKDKIRTKIKELEELFDKNEKEITIQYQNQFIVDVVGVLEELLGDDE